jgi:hypothetical protein
MRMRLIVPAGLGLMVVVGSWWGLPAWGGETGSPSASASAGKGRSGSEDDDLPRLVLLASGTQVGRTLPPGWSHLVVKSVPRLVSGDLDSLPEIASATATLFHTVLLADVRAVEIGGKGPQFHLRRVGLGLCTLVKDVDTVVTPSGQETLGLDLGLVASQVLERAEEELAKGRIIARTPTFALFSSPAELRVLKGHRPILLRYALLADPETGSLRTTVCAISAERERRKPVPRVALLADGLICASDLDVAASRLLGTVPFHWSFALRSLPPGRAILLPPGLQGRFTRDTFSPADAAAFEAELRRTLAQQG